MDTGITKILILVGSILVVLLAITFGIRTYRNTQDQANEIGTQITDKVNNAIELQFTQYDGATISGSEVINVIKETYAATDYAQVVVETSAGSKVEFVTKRAAGATTIGPGDKLDDTIYSTRVNTAQDKTSADYIAPTGSFLGTVSRDSNGTIVEVYFKQQ